MRRRHLLAAALLALGMAGTGSALPAHAATITDCPTTQSALGSDITAAGPGGTVTIHCATDTTIPFTGTYYTSSSVTLDASGSLGKVTFDGGNAHEILWVNQGNVLTLDGLTLSHGSYGYGGAIENRGTLNVSGSTFSNNAATTGGGAIDNFAGTVTISNSDFSNNSAGSYGGAIYNETALRSGTYTQGSMTISGSTFDSNSAYDAGAISNPGALSISGSILRNNTATQYGGAINNDDFVVPSLYASLTINDSTLSGNSTSGTVTFGTGGALFSGYGNATITNSTLSSNSAVQGGAIYMLSRGGNGGTVNLSNSTLSGNQLHAGVYITFGGERGGGGLYLEPGTTATIRNSTLTRNSAGSAGKGGALYSSNATARFHNSTVADNSAAEHEGGALYVLSPFTFVDATIIAHNTGGNCSLHSYTLGDQGYNLETGTDCGLTGATDITSTDPKVKPLASNGGPTETMALDETSRAIDAIPASSGLCPATDQRGVARLDDMETACDVGAYEHVDHLRIDISVAAGGPYSVYVDGANLEAGSVVDWRAKTVHGDHAGTIVVPTSGIVHQLVFSHACPSGHVIVDASGREVTPAGIHDVTAHYEGDPC